MPQPLLFQIDSTLWLAMELLVLGAARLHLFPSGTDLHSATAVYDYGCAFVALEEATRLVLQRETEPHGWDSRRIGDGPFEFRDGRRSDRRTTRKRLPSRCT